jgi:hypothetical protein
MLFLWSEISSRVAGNPASERRAAVCMYTQQLVPSLYRAKTPTFDILELFDKGACSRILTQTSLALQHLLSGLYRGLGQNYSFFGLSGVPFWSKEEYAGLRASYIHTQL